MKLERAQEIYSEYAEGTLTPALRLALEQHFAADPAARADYDAFARIFALLETPGGEDVEVPLGFRAKILERAAAEQGRRETTFNSLTPVPGGRWFQTAAYRRTLGGTFAAIAAVAVLGVMLFTHSTLKPRTDNSGMGFSIPVTTTVSPEMLQSIDTPPGQATASHLFHLHLPETVPAATVNAYVVTSIDQITDPSRLADATHAMKDLHLTNRQGVQIPIAPLQARPAGSTLDVLVNWTPDDTTQPAGSEAIFTPFGAASPSSTAPINAGFLEAAQSVASHYGVTVVVEADAVPTQTFSPDFSGTDPTAALTSLANAAGFKIQALQNSTYYLYDPTQAH